MSVKKDELRAKRLQARAVLDRVGGLAFKPESSAKWVDIRRSWTGILRVQIEHDDIRGCTPQMMRWWFENLAATTPWNGHDMSGPEVSFYHLWHHRDHVAVTPLTPGADGQPNQGFAVGGRSVIAEQFNDHHERVHALVETTTLDDREFTFLIKKFGLTAGRIVHYYASVPGGISFYAETEIGSRIPVLGWLLNWIVVPFLYSRQTAEHWIKHNIEETGRSEQVIPHLYRIHRE